MDAALPPTISLEDLVGRCSAVAEATTRVLLSRCRASSTEIEALEAHLRRCLQYPVTAHPPTHTARFDILRAIVDELRGRGHGLEQSSCTKFDKVPSAKETTQVGLVDIKDAIRCCDEQIIGRLASEEIEGRSDARLSVRRRALGEVHDALIARLAKLGTASKMEGFSAGAASTPCRSSIPVQGGKPLGRVRRALSFDKRRRLHKTDTADGVDGIEEVQEDVCKQPPLENRAVAKVVARSLSFDRFRRRVGGARRDKAVPIASHAQPDMGSVSSSFEAGSESAPPKLSSKSRNKLAMMRVANASSKKPHSSDFSDPKDETASLTAARQLHCATRLPNCASGQSSSQPCAAKDNCPAAPEETFAFNCDLESAGRLYEILLFALISAWQRRAFGAMSRAGTASTIDMPPPFPVDEDGSLLLRNGVSGWLLDEFAARYAVSPLWRALGVLSAAVEVAMQSDAGGDGCGASADVLCLACNALVEVLTAMQTENAQTGDPVTDMRVQQPGASSLRRAMRKSSALAFESAAAAVASNLNRRSQHLKALMQASSECAKETHEGSGEACSNFREIEHDDGTASIGAVEMACFTRCMTSLWSYISARLPPLIAERDEALAEDVGDVSSDQSVSAVLLVQLLSLSHRLTFIAGSAHDSSHSSGPARELRASSDQDWTANQVDARARFVWQYELCPPSLSAAARAALRTAVTLMCNQELQAALQTCRPSATPTRSKAMACPASLEHQSTSGDVTVHMVRLRRLRDRLQRTLPLQTALLANVVGGAPGIVQVWAEALGATVVEPLQELCTTIPVRPHIVQMLSACLDLRRICSMVDIICDPAEAARDGGDLHFSADRMNDCLGAEMPSTRFDELGIVYDSSWFSPFVHEWLSVASLELVAWLKDAFGEETQWRLWRPIGPHRCSSTLVLLFRACASLVRSLGRLGVVQRGEAVSAAHIVADLHDLFAKWLAAAVASSAKASIEQDGPSTASDMPCRAAEEGRAVQVYRDTGAPVGMSLKTAARGLLGGYHVLITYVQPASPFAQHVRPGERVLSINSEPVVDSAHAMSLLQKASQVKLCVAAPPGLDDLGEGCSFEDLFRRRAAARSEIMRQLLLMLDIEQGRPPDDPLDIRADDDGSELDALECDLDDDVLVDAIALETPSEASGTMILSTNDLGASLLESFEVDQLRRHALIASNAWVARYQLQILASKIEGMFRTSTEHRSIVSQTFISTFALLRQVVESEMGILTQYLCAPFRNYMALLGFGTTPTSNSKRAIDGDVLQAAYAPILDLLPLWLAPDAMHRLLRRVWSEAVADVTRQLPRNFYVPKALGDEFVARAISSLQALSAVVHGCANSPSKDWIRQRVAPLHSALVLASLPTEALLQQARVQPVGQKRAAPLAALALRMDDQQAAELIAAEMLSDLQDDESFVIDGTASLAPYCNLEPLL